MGTCFTVLTRRQVPYLYHPGRIAHTDDQMLHRAGECGMTAVVKFSFAALIVSRPSKGSPDVCWLLGIPSGSPHKAELPQHQLSVLGCPLCAISRHCSPTEGPRW